jgi:hypothetical protein
MTTNLPAKRDPVTTLAETLGFDRATLANVLAKTVMPSSTRPEDALAFCAVANSLGLNPLAKEIYAFPGKSGGIQPIVGVDGWVTIARRKSPGVRFLFDDVLGPDGSLISVTARIVERGDSHPIAEVTEYMVECKRGTDPWRTAPRRMLRHKALIQAIRYAFGVSGVIDEDEYARMTEREVEAMPAKPRTLDALSKSLDTPTIVRVPTMPLEEGILLAERDAAATREASQPKRDAPVNADNPFAGWDEKHGEGEGDPEAQQ